MCPTLALKGWNSGAGDRRMGSSRVGFRGELGALFPPLVGLRG
jgi:hypothetical protein